MQLIRTVCDLCYGRGEEMVAMEPSVLVTFGDRAVEVDLCEQDRKAVETALFDVFAQGRRPEGVVQARGRRRTKSQIEADRLLRDPTSPIGAAVRTLRAPGASGRPPGKYDSYWRSDGTYRCPDDTCPQTFTGPSGIGRHVTTKHPNLAVA